MKMPIVIYEDKGFRNLLPLVFTKPVYELKCGFLSLKQKIEKHFPKSRLILHSRRYFEGLLKEKYPNTLINNFNEEPIMFLNGRLLCTNEIVKEIKKLNEGCALLSNDEIVAIKITKKNIKNLLFDEDGIISFNKIKATTKQVNAKLIKYPWDLINNNGNEIINDYLLLKKYYQSRKSIPKFPDVKYINKKNIYIGKNSFLYPYVVLDASNGPVIIENNVKVMPFSFIEGPAYIGKNCLVKAHTKLYHNSTIGEGCKIAGEIENSIFHSYSNKQHNGFIGHSYIGSWVNLGAGTTNSDLKNDYGIVEVIIDGNKIKTDNIFVGLFMGDYSKTAIGTTFNTGSVIGVSCNIFGNGFPPKYVPSFTWGGINSFEEYKIEKAISVAKVVAARRNVEFNNNDELILRKVFEITAKERNF